MIQAKSLEIHMKREEMAEVEPVADRQQLNFRLR